MNQRQLGFLQIIFAGVFFGFLGLFGKTAYRNGILPGELLALRFLSSAFMLGSILLILNKQPFQLGRKKIISSLLLGAFGYAVFSSCYFMALEGLSASLTVLLLYMYPVLVTLGARSFFKEDLGRSGWVALIITSIGLVGLVWGEWTVSRPIYLLFGIGSAVFYAVYILVSRKVLKEVDPMRSSFFVQLGAGVMLFAIHYANLERPLLILNENYLLIVGMAIVCTLLPLTLFLAGLQKISSSEASVLSTTEPVFGVIIATIFLHEQMSLIQIAGGIFVISGLILTSIKK